MEPCDAYPVVAALHTVVVGRTHSGEHGMRHAPAVDLQKRPRFGERIGAAVWAGLDVDSELEVESSDS